jgi:hypothetical protein
MGQIFYYMLTFAESVGSVFGLRFPYEQPRYAVIARVSDVEIRRYQPRLAIEAMVDAKQNPQAANLAFQLLFRYITGANQRRQMIAMTVPVHIDNPSQRIAMTVPVQTERTGGDAVSMRFFLPDGVAKQGAPAPLDSRLRLVNLPAATVATLRYSGLPTQAAFREESARLLRALAPSEWKPAGTVFQLSYDPPFTIPFLRRNEVAVDVTGTAQ